jgi:hypothetical protein
MISLLSSCIVTHQGSISSASVGKSVKYVDLAVGVSQVNKFLGFGGVSKDALILESRRQMITSRPLQANEEYVNFTVDFKRTFFLFWSETKVTVCADVINFSNVDSGNVYTDSYKKKILSQLTSNKLFEPGDSIIYRGKLYGTILSFVSAGKVRILYKTKKNIIRTKILSVDAIFTTKKGFKGYVIGGRYTYDIPVSIGSKIQISGKIIALGLHSLIIKEDDGRITTLEYYN